MIYVVNYADEKFEKAQKYNTKTAYKVGKADKVIECSPKTLQAIAPSFLQKNYDDIISICNARKGKYGLWRPIILKYALGMLKYGDYLMYCDSGAYFINDIHLLTNFMQSKTIDILTFNSSYQEGTLLERQYTKRDIFVYMGCDTAEYTDSCQRASGYFVIFKDKKTVEIIDKYVQLAEDAPFLFTDEQNKLGKENYADFVDVRHNQSVWSILTKLYGIPAYRDPSQFGYPFGSFNRIYADIIRKTSSSSYPQVIVLHRQGELSLQWRVRVWFQYHMPIFYAVLYQYNFLILLKNKLSLIKHKLL